MHIQNPNNGKIDSKVDSKIESRKLAKIGCDWRHRYCDVWYQETVWCQ